MANLEDVILEPFNNYLAKYGYEMKFSVMNGQYYLDIYYEDGEKSYNYAGGYEKNNELSILIVEAFDHLRGKISETSSFTYVVVDGWTHGMPALIYSLTDVSLFFHDSDTGEIVNVDDAEGGIDSFEDRNGDFCVRGYEYKMALRQVEDHDVRGVER